MTLLVTGASGFVGQHIVMQNGNCLVLSSDLLQPEQLVRELGALAFDAVIHLAAQSFVPESFANPRNTYDVNFYGTYNLLSALKAAKFTGKFLFISSGDVYGKISEQSLPILESQLPKPGNPYAVSKIAAEALCYQWSQTEQFEIMVARPFNHIGPGQREQFAVSSFAKQIVEVKLGLRPPVIDVGDIDVTRDFSDVRDIVQAYKLLLLHGQNGEIYNVASGKELSLREVLSRLIEQSGKEIEIRQDPARLRLSDQRRVCGSNQKLLAATAWQPTYSIEQTLKDLLVYWEKQLT